MDGRTKKIAAILIISSILLVILFTLLTGSNNTNAGISIDGDDELVKEAESRGWSGDGSVEDPFLISGTKMNLTGSAPCIMLSKTTMYIVIRDCELAHKHDGQGSMIGTGIKLDYVKNVVLENNIVKSVQSGLEITSCTDLTIRNNSIQGAENGIDLNRSMTNLFIGNEFGTFNSFHIFGSDNNTFIDNTFLGQGSNIMMSSNENHFMNNNISAIEGTGLLMESCSNNVFEGNLFEGKPLGAGGTRGFVGLVLSGSMGNSFNNDQMKGGAYLSIGISAIYSSDNSISNCHISGRTGIYMINSNENVISNNDIRSASIIALDMVSSDSNIITGNTMNGTYSETGIRLFSCDQNIINENSISGRSIASFLIFANNSSGNLVFKNTLEYQGTESRTLKLAWDDTGLNLWNDTEFGNYWNDWTSIDVDLDGFVDYPYVLEGDAGATDWHPLVDSPF